MPSRSRMAAASHPSPTAPRTVPGGSVGCWSRKATLTPRPRRTEPSSGSPAPASTRSRVDLPAPLRPTTPSRSPVDTVTDRSSNSGRSGRRTVARSTSTRIISSSVGAAAPYPDLVLEVHGLTIDLGHKVLLRDASFQVAPGEKVALVGPNGAGKTTLLRTIARELEPTDGHILLPETYGWLRQDVQASPDDAVKTGIDHILAGRDTAAVAAELELALAEMASLSADGLTADGRPDGGRPTAAGQRWQAQRRPVQRWQAQRRPVQRWQAQRWRARRWRTQGEGLEGCPRQRGGYGHRGRPRPAGSTGR